MVICNPGATLGGKTFWKTLQQDPFFILQEHKFGPPFWWGSPFRILIKCNSFVIAQAASQEEIEEDWKNIQGGASQLELTNLLPANLSVLLIAFFHLRWLDTEDPMGISLDKEEEPENFSSSSEQSQNSSARQSKNRGKSAEWEAEGMLLEPEALTWASEQFAALKKHLQAEENPPEPLQESVPLEIAPEDIEFGEFIGEGVYSEVYKGSCYGTPVAIKKFKNQGFDL